MTFIKTDLTGYGKITSGSYVGDSSANKAIAHGLGVTPKLTLIISSENVGWMHFDILRSGYINGFHDAAQQTNTVTAADTTNFYVGNISDYGATANGGHTYYWVAFA